MHLTGHQKYSSGCADSFATFISVINTVEMLRKNLYIIASLDDITAMNNSGTKIKAIVEE